MLIESVRLKNIKSFSDAEICFKPGVNFIKGANGTGKSTLIESVGFAMFNVTNTGFSAGIHSYLLREGEREGEVLVRFQSNGQSYEILRTVGPDANRRKWQIACNGEPVMGLMTDKDKVAYLQDAMGLPPEQKPDKLFTDMIGVKQGQFRAPFEESRTVRMQYFNEIFGVADFNRARDNMSKVKSNIQSKKKELQNLTAALEGTVAQLGEKKEEYEKLLGLQKAAEEAFLRLSEQSRQAKETHALANELELLAAQIETVRVQGEKQLTAALAEQEKAQAGLLALQEQEKAALQQGEDHKENQKALDTAGIALEKIARDATGTSEYLHGTIDRIAYDRQNVIKSLEEAKLEASKLENGLCPYFNEACDKMQEKKAADRTAPILEKLNDIESRFRDALVRPRKMEWEQHIDAYRLAAQDLSAGFGPVLPNPQEALEPYFIFCRAEGAPEQLKDALACWEGEIGRIRETYAAHFTALQKEIDERTKALISKSAMASQATKSAKKTLTDCAQKIGSIQKELETAGQKEQRREEILCILGDKQIGAQEANAELIRISGEAERADEQRRQYKSMQESLARDIQQMEQTRQRMEEYKQQSKELTQADATAGLLADLFRRAGGRVAELYTKRISAWAASMYRVVAQDGAELQFDTEYDAKLVDIYKGIERQRSFNQLSGGQRMIAALCVRIAMLTCFAGLPVAFFDEPTENIDAEKKLNLAENLKKMLGDFTQIFIISHDDAFDRLTENVIYLQETREGTVCSAL
jgi:DNA repair protein SbcC/Rad50